MRGTVAKRLRARVLDQVPTAVLLSLSDAPRYAVKPGTIRVYKRPTGEMIADEHGNEVPEMVEYLRTCTFELAKDCRRYFTQRYKRGFVRSRSERSLAA